MKGRRMVPISSCLVAHGMIQAFEVDTLPRTQELGSVPLDS